MRYSISKWENSFFGGYDRVVIDHPPIIVPKEIITELPDNDLTIPFYVRQKLINLFLLKNEQMPKAKDLLFADGEINKSDKGSFYEFNKKSIKKSLKEIIKLDSELFNLFEYYSDFICNTKYKIQVNNESNSESDSSHKSDSPKSDKKEQNKANDNKEVKTSSVDENKSELDNSVKDLVNKFFEKIKKFEFDDEKSISSPTLKKSTKFRVLKKTKEKCAYTNDELVSAGRLTNLLDINFDPQSDKVSNLKLGKIDINKIAEIPSGNTQIYYKIEENQSTKPFSVCILCDESGSMLGDYHKLQHSMVKILYKTFSSILPPDKIYIYGHSGDYTPEIRVYNDKYNNDFEFTVGNQLNNEYSENYDGPVIENIYEKIRSHTDDNIIFIVITDGLPYGKNYGGKKANEELKQTIEKCKRDGFVTVGIGLGINYVKNIYQYYTVIDRHTCDGQTIKNVSNLINKVVKTEFQM